MAKGKITEYDVGSFSPAATGVPGQDKSGQIIASGISSLGDALAVREATSNKISAANEFGNFDFKYQQQKLDLQKAYQNDPEAYPAAAKEAAIKLADESGKGMAGGVYAEYKTLTSKAIMQDTEGNAKWAFGRKLEIDGENFTSSSQNVALSASLGQSPQDLEAVFHNFDKIGTDALPNLKPEFVTKTLDTYKKQAIENNFNAQLLAQPMEFKIALDGGAYTELLRKNGFGPGIVKEYSDKAQNALINRSIADQYRTLWSSQDKALSLVRGLDNGSMSIIDVISERAAMNANRNAVDPVTKKPIVPEGYVRILDSIIADKTNSIIRTPLGKEEKEKALKAFDTQWDEYLITKDVQNKKPGPEDLEKQLELMKGLMDARNSGVIDSNDFDAKIAIMTTKHNLGKDSIFGARPFNESVDKAGMVNVWGQNRPANDVISIGYTMIKNHVDKAYPDLPENERRDMKAQLLAQYHAEIKALPEGTLKQPKPENFFVGLARKYIYGAKDADGKDLTRGILETNSMYREPAAYSGNKPVPGYTGNIDLNNRPVVQNADGSVSTELSRSFKDSDGKEVLIPTVVNGKIVSDKEAWAHYKQTGENLGKFNTVAEADAMANKIHTRGVVTPGQTYYPGDIVYKSQVPTIFRGRDPTSGKPKFSLPPGIEGTTRLVNGKPYRIDGLDSDGDVIATRVEN